MFRASVFGAGILACVGLSAGMMQRQVVDCPARLMEEGYKFEQISGYDVGQCSIDEPVKLYSTPTTKLHRPVTLSCSFAHAFGKWTEDVGAKRMTHMGGYNCRKIAGSIFMSQHSYGNAIDISIIDGVSISKNWEEPASKACIYFTNVLTPATNAAHHDHLHLDNGVGLPCWIKSISFKLWATFDLAS